MTDDIHSSLLKHFGFNAFRSGQEEAINSLLAGQHTLVVMPTGSGKSLIFQMAAMHLPGITLVISPLIALMKDQVDSLGQRSIQATFINSSLASGEQNQRLEDLMSGKYKLVYIAPERLRSTRFMNALRNQEIGLLAVDEAHCISEWGHDFRPDYLHISHFRSVLGDPLTAALTATATPKVQADISQALNLSPVQLVVTGFNRPNLSLEVRYVTNPTRRFKALQSVIENYVEGGRIVYTGTRRDAEEVAEFVTTVVGIKTLAYHAGLLPNERTRIQNQFIAGDLSVVAATNAFGMGIDRPDVRQVIHYNLPGSLEAYYQEAGRAGRDGLPARAVLMYLPDDRSLQEWFIENSDISIDDLRLVYNTLRQVDETSQQTTYAEISRLAELQEVKVRMCMANLEQAVVLERLGDEGFHFRVKLHGWKSADIEKVVGKLKRHKTHQKEQLDRMIEYAESNVCRRKIILQHFGDRGLAEADICCDNCQSRNRGASHIPERQIGKDADKLTQSERIGLIILDTIRRLKNDVGAEKLAQILKGSKAKDILKFGYDKNVYYGRLSAFSMDELRGMIDQLVELGYLKVTGGKYPVHQLSPKGEVALHNKAPVSINIPREVTRQEIDNKKAEKQAGGSLEYTAQLFLAGLSVEQIAVQRGLTLNTIYSHAAKLIPAGRVSLVMVVPEDVRKRIETAIFQVGSVEYLFPIKVLLPDEISYEMIRCVVEDWKIKEIFGRKSKLPSQNEIYLKSEIENQEDSIVAFLSNSHPRPLPGPWEVGWSLGFHSSFRGEEWQRSGPGELAYRLKYQDDLSVIPELVDQIAKLVVEHPEITQVDAVVPVPPSITRSHDPVSSIAKALAERLGLAVLPVLSKARRTTPQKELNTLAQKRRNVAGAFDLHSPVKGKRLLVVDDLFDSGATLEEIYRLLRSHRAVKVNVLTLTRTIHSDT